MSSARCASQRVRLSPLAETVRQRGAGADGLGWPRRYHSGPPGTAVPTTSPKQAVRRLVDQLDDNVSFEDIQYKLYVVQQIERGLRDVEEGRTVSHQDARSRLDRWLSDAPGDRG